MDAGIGAAISPAGSKTVIWPRHYADEAVSGGDVTQDRDELIREICALLVDDETKVTPDWRHLVLVAWLGALSLKLNGFTYDADSHAIPTSLSNPILPFKFRELAKVMRTGRKKPWKACLVRINRVSGETSCDFEYSRPEKWRIAPTTIKQMAEKLRPRG